MTQSDMTYAWFVLFQRCASHRTMHMSYRSKTYTWNDVILGKGIIGAYAGCYVTWYRSGQLTSKYHSANDTWPDAHYGILELENYPEASNWDRMRVIVLRYARRRTRIVCYRVEESFNETFPSCDGLTSRRGTFWHHVKPVDPQPLDIYIPICPSSEQYCTG
jgi:hypothetical protein